MQAMLRRAPGNPKADFGSDIGLRALAASRLPCKVSADAPGTLRLRKNRTKSASRGQRSAGRFRTLGDAKVWPQFQALKATRFGQRSFSRDSRGPICSKFRYERTHDDHTH